MVRDYNLGQKKLNPLPPKSVIIQAQSKTRTRYFSITEIEGWGGGGGLIFSFELSKIEDGPLHQGLVASLAKKLNFTLHRVSSPIL